MCVYIYIYIYIYTCLGQLRRRKQRRLARPGRRLAASDYENGNNNISSITMCMYTFMWIYICVYIIYTYYKNVCLAASVKINSA